MLLNNDVLRQLFSNHSSTKIQCMEAIKIYPELQKWKVNKNGLASLTIRFDYDRQRIGNEKLGYTIQLADWDPVTKRVKSSDPNYVLLNQLIENRLNKHTNYFLRRETFNLPISRDLIKKYVKSKAGLEDFYEYAEQVIQTKKMKDGLHYSDDTKRRYRDEIKRLMQYRLKLNFKDIQPDFLNNYRSWMQFEYLKKDKTHLDKNSIWKAFSFIRMVYNQAIKDQIILPDDNPFKKFEVGSYEENTDKIKWLELNQIESIEKVLIEKEMPVLTRRIGWRYLAMCVSGLRISDAMYLDDMYFNDRGDLEFKPYKTRRYKNKAQVPIISERQQRYFEMTLSMPLPQTDHKSFRTTFNNHLRIISAMAGISLDFTSHSARHTMGSFMVDAGIEDKAAKAILGVKKDKVLNTYMHLKQGKLNKEAEKLKNVF